jgi:hypothetical protein
MKNTFYVGSVPWNTDISRPPAGHNHWRSEEVVFHLSPGLHQRPVTQKKDINQQHKQKSSNRQHCGSSFVSMQIWIQGAKPIRIHAGPDLGETLKVLSSEMDPAN